MQYEVVLTEQPEDFLKKCDKPIKDRILDKLENLKENPRLGKHLSANLAGLWSLRFGKWRALYEIKDNELIVLIMELNHRKDIYSRK